jgi:hypothetical protein
MIAGTRNLLTTAMIVVSSFSLRVFSLLRPGFSHLRSDLANKLLLTLQCGSCILWHANRWSKKPIIYRQRQRAMDTGHTQALSAEVACALRERLGACIWIRFKIE